MNKFGILLITGAILASCVQFSNCTCRVLSDCGEEGIDWKITGDEMLTGRPGKHGPPGPRGQKGEPGIGVNVTELKSELRRESAEPVLYFYTNTITWNSGKAFCRALHKRMCSSDQLCTRHDGGRQLIPDVIPGDNWVPVIDGYNDWLQSGHSHGRTCMKHIELGSKAAWGTTTTAAAHKGYVYCCNDDSPSNLGTIRMKYQYIGKMTNYEKSRNHCEKQDLRLCYASEICSQNAPQYGPVEGDHWVAVQDRFNEWIEIGNSGGRTCWVHGVRYTLPDWGIRKSGEANHVGFVLCCQS